MHNQGMRTDRYCQTTISCQQQLLLSITMKVKMQSECSNYNDIHKAMSNSNLTQVKLLSGTRY